MSTNFENTTLIGQSVDELVQLGARHVQANGDRFDARAGSGVQAWGTTYVLEDAAARVHTLRAPESVTYLARELHAYFLGSLAVEDGLAQAAPFWRNLSDNNGNICSNYGYYTFRQPTAAGGTQLDWVRKCFKGNPDTRKAFININGIDHKTQTNLDFPCTIGMQFSIRNGKMNCDVASRSADVVTGLPYDMAFFSLVNELVAGLVKEDSGRDISVGYTAMRTIFTQIYDKRMGKLEQILDGTPNEDEQHMPLITQPTETLSDILQISTREPVTDTILWVQEHRAAV